MTKLYIRGLNIFVVLSQIMNVVGVYEKHFFVVVYKSLVQRLKELNRYKIGKEKNLLSSNIAFALILN